MKDPVIVLAPVRSYSTLVAAMLGQHPQMYSLLETHLFICDTMRNWWMICLNGRMAHGLLRSVAELMLGHQSVTTIELARLWILRRLNWSTSDVFRVLASRVHPLILVDKSPLIVTRPEHLQRALDSFPGARFLHLIRNPSDFGRSYLRLLEYLGYPVRVDPQVVWHRQHSTILQFLAKLPSWQHLRVRGEDLLASPDTNLARIAGWIGLRTDRGAIDRMKHPERSPFARFGPPNAFSGGDMHFFRSPTFRRSVTTALAPPPRTPWRIDDVSFSPQIRELAQHLGYQ